MIRNKLFSAVLLGVFTLITAPSCTAAVDSGASSEAELSIASGHAEALESCIGTMTERHHFDKAELDKLFQSVQLKPAIIKAMTRPAEAMPWFKYRAIFMTDKRIDAGARFWREHENVLNAVEEKTGVPASVIVAILGVETFYGGNTGSFRVIDALATLGFDYPKRSTFFLSELEQFLLLCREENIDPLMPKGSYAGAMGMPQFMPSSYRSYAADYDGDNNRDIWNNPADVIASIANYFVKHHWQAGGAIALKADSEGDTYKKALGGDLKPDLTVAQLKSLKVTTAEALAPEQKAKLLAYQQEQGEDLWLGLDNFYVITRYNRSPLYAMAVYQLSRAIADNKNTVTKDE